MAGRARARAAWPSRAAWASMPDAERRRPSIKLTLSPEAQERLRALAEAAGVSRSAWVEARILEGAKK